MKINAIVLVAGMVGSLALGGCKSSHDTAKPVDSQASAPVTVEASNAVAPEENVAAAPVEEATKAPGIEKDERRFHYYAPHAPPAMRHETWGRAPSDRHFWAPGYYRWSGREHVWYDGRWELRRPGYEYVSPRWVNVYGRWEYMPGYWARR